MFGYIVADFGNMSDEDKKRYRSYYCGLCHSLKKQDGNISRLTLTYDFTFIALILSELYENGTLKKERCLPHPFSAHEYLESDIIDYVADMNLLLYYINLLDDWQDDKSISSLAKSRIFERNIQNIRERHPEEFDLVFESLSELSAAEKRGEQCPDIPASAFGKLLGNILSFKKDEYSESLFDFGNALGKFIYIQDACVDFEKDLKKEKYNPLTTVRVSDFEDILKVLAADCAKKLELIPVIKDDNIVKNIIYSGVWTRYEQKRAFYEKELQKKEKGE